MQFSQIKTFKGEINSMLNWIFYTILNRQYVLIKELESGQENVHIMQFNVN